MQWLGTREGQKYLKENIEQNISLVQDDRISALLSEDVTNKMWKDIESATKPQINHSVADRSIQFSFWHIAAAVLLIMTSSVFYYWHQEPVVLPESQQVVQYSTGEEQQKNITLSDGTEIRLNANSRIQISQEYGKTGREIDLEGEAYFKVIHDDNKPLVVKTPQAIVKDLGTAFNINAYPEHQNIQVAVTEGKVLLWSNRYTEDQATTLVEGEFAFLDLVTHHIEKNDFGVHNYLSWMNGRLKFNRDPLKDVSRQISNIYDVSIEFSEDSLKNLKLTTDFERGSLEKILEVISLTLDISYRIEGEKVIWLADKAKSQSDLKQGSRRKTGSSLQKEFG